MTTNISQANYTGLIEKSQPFDVGFAGRVLTILHEDQPNIEPYDVWLTLVDINAVLGTDMLDDAIEGLDEFLNYGQYEDWI
jgi:hypothetical protein